MRQSIIIVAVAGSLLVGCGPQVNTPEPVASETTTSTTETTSGSEATEGVTRHLPRWSEVVVTSSATEEVILQASRSSAIVGVSVAIPPQNFVERTTVSIRAGASLIEEAPAIALGLWTGNRAVWAGQTAIISADQISTGSDGLTVSLPLPADGEAQGFIMDQLLVIYREWRGVDGGGWVNGVRSGQQIKVEADRVVFTARDFGAFQAVYLETSPAATSERSDVTRMSGIRTLENMPYFGQEGLLSAEQLTAIEETVAVKWSSVTNTVESDEASVNLVGEYSGVGTLADCVGILREEESAPPLIMVQADTALGITVPLPANSPADLEGEIYCVDESLRGTRSESTTVEQDNEA